MGHSVGHERLAMFEVLRVIGAVVIAAVAIAILTWALGGKIDE